MPEVPESYGNCRFYVGMGTNAKFLAVFTEASGLQVELEVFEYEEGGENAATHRLPGRAKVGNLTLKRGMTRSETFCEWCLEVASGKITRYDVTVVMIDTRRDATLQKVATWVFHNAFPVKWVGPQFVADGTAAAVETLELAHTGVTLVDARGKTTNLMLTFKPA